MASDALTAVDDFFKAQFDVSLTDIVQNVADAFKSVYDWAHDALTNAANFFNATFSDPISGILESISGWFDSVISKAGTAIEKVQTFWGWTLKRETATPIIHTGITGTIRELRAKQPALTMCHIMTSRQSYMQAKPS